LGKLAETGGRRGGIQSAGGIGIFKLGGGTVDVGGPVDCHRAVGLYIDVLELYCANLLRHRDRGAIDLEAMLIVVLVKKKSAHSAIGFFYIRHWIR
jgi:hypothetical protein